MHRLCIERGRQPLSGRKAVSAPSCHAPVVCRVVIYNGGFSVGTIHYCHDMREVDQIVQRLTNEGRLFEIEKITGDKS